MKPLHTISQVRKINHAVAGIGSTITADTIPDGDGGWFDSGWGCAEWGIWLEENFKKYGKDTTKKKFITEWNKQGIWDVQYTWCKYDSGFVATVKKTTGEDFGHLVSQVITSSKEVVTNATEGVNSLSKYLTYLPAITIIGLSVYFRKDIKTAYKKLIK